MPTNPLLLAIVTGLAAIASIGDAPSDTRAQSALMQCHVKAFPATDLRTADGRTVYVEANSFVAQGSHVFLAGRPNFIYHGKQLEVNDGVFGVTFKWPGPVQIVHAPELVGRASDPRLISLGNGQWGAVFSELQPGSTIPHNPPLIHLWYAMFDGSSWSHMEQIPIPAVGKLRSRAASDLIANGETLTLAMPLDSVSMDMPGESNVAIFTRSHGRWSVNVAYTRFASYVSLMSLGANGLRLAVVTSDTSRHAGDSNSLFIYGPGPEWPNLGVVIQGGEKPVHFPLLRRDHTRFVVSWMEIPRRGSAWIALTDRGRTAGLLSRPAAHLDSPITIDSSALQLMQPVVDGAQTQWWVTDHAASTGSSDVRELRLFDDSHGVPRLVSRIPNEFSGEVAASVLLLSPERILVAGPYLHDLPGGDGYVATQIVFNRRC